MTKIYIYLTSLIIIIIKLTTITRGGRLYNQSTNICLVLLFLRLTLLASLYPSYLTNNINLSTIVYNFHWDFFTI